MLVTLLPIVIFRKLLQNENAIRPMLVTPLPIEAVVRPEEKNAHSSTVMTLSGMMMLLRLPHPENARSPIIVTPLPIVTLVKPKQDEKAEPPMLVTLFGITTAERLDSKNAESPMRVTGRPSIVSGMITASAGPVYLVMVIRPLSFVELNWVC